MCFRENDVDTGVLIRDDFAHCIEQLAEQGVAFDLVYFVGVIEHFTNYMNIILMYDKILKPDGILIIETPDFCGKIQYIMHLLLIRRIWKDMW